MTAKPGAVGANFPIQRPRKLIRIASMARAMLDEARVAPCDTAGCERFREIYERTLRELNGALSEDLRIELSYLTLTFDDPSPSPSELRVAQAELVGWLEGLFSGMAASAAVRQEVARDQIEAIGETTGDTKVLIDAGTMPGQYL